jgi:hypothetical protein
VCPPLVRAAASLDLVTGRKGEQMTEEGVLSIMRRGTNYQVRYASYNPYNLERPPYVCHTEAALVALLRHSGIDAWALQQAMATVRKGEMAVVPIVRSALQMHADFPSPMSLV